MISADFGMSLDFLCIANFPVCFRKGNYEIGSLAVDRRHAERPCGTASLAGGGLLRRAAVRETLTLTTALWPSEQIGVSRGRAVSGAWPGAHDARHPAARRDQREHRAPGAPDQGRVV